MPYANLRQELEDAAFRHHLRDELYQSLRADPVKRGRAQAELDRLENGKPHGLLERDAISKHIYDMLQTMFRQIADDPPEQSAPARIVEA